MEHQFCAPLRGALQEEIMWSSSGSGFIKASIHRSRSGAASTKLSTKAFLAGVKLGWVTTDRRGYGEGSLSIRFLVSE